MIESHEGRKVSVERKVGECYQWRAVGQCSKGGSCSFSHGEAPGNPARSRTKRDKRIPTPKAPTQTDGKTMERLWSQRENAISGKRMGSVQEETLADLATGLSSWTTSTIVLSCSKDADTD